MASTESLNPEAYDVWSAPPRPTGSRFDLATTPAGMPRKSPGQPVTLAYERIAEKLRDQLVPVGPGLVNFQSRRVVRREIFPAEGDTSGLDPVTYEYLIVDGPIEQPRPTWVAKAKKDTKFKPKQELGGAALDAFLLGHAYGTEMPPPLTEDQLWESARRTAEETKMEANELVQLSSIINAVAAALFHGVKAGVYQS